MGAVHRCGGDQAGLSGIDPTWHTRTRKKMVTWKVQSLSLMIDMSAATMLKLKIADKIKLQDAAVQKSEVEIHAVLDIYEEEGPKWCSIDFDVSWPRQRR